MSESSRVEPLQATALRRLCTGYPSGGFLYPVTLQRLALQLLAQAGIDPNRKRGDEYNANGIGELDDVTQVELETRIETLAPELEKVIQKKAGKYEIPPTLLIYLNIADHGRAEKKIEEAIARLKAKHAASFNGIHVIGKSKLY
jgi:hypothetical protein